MEAILKFKLSRQELLAQIPFGALAECENKLKTVKAKRLMAEIGISLEMLKKYQEIARRWYLITGCPDEQEFTLHEMDDWYKIAQLIMLL